jgi:hypothetical protein
VQELMKRTCARIIMELSFYNRDFLRYLYQKKSWIYCADHVQYIFQDMEQAW